MNVEYTGRHYEVTAADRKEIESGLSKIKKILHGSFESKVILAVEKHRHKAEIAINSRVGDLVAISQAKDMQAAIGNALEHLEKQALKNKTRIIAKKRRNHKEKNGADEVQVQSSPAAQTPAVVGSSTVSMVVHKFPAFAKSTDVHLVRSEDAVALRPMTLEEAIKEAHFRDRDVFVFRDPKGKLMILHRMLDGKMELIEAP
ncbi:MAG: ribosome hibernation-promoting factor, HPF/YfiA family [Terriglobales bacterium]